MYYSLVVLGLFSELSELESNQTLSQQLGVISYGISMTTLEDVFLKLGKQTRCFDVRIWYAL